MNRILYYWTAVVAALSATANAATYLFSYYPDFLDFLFILHALIFVPFGIFVVKNRGNPNKTSTKLGDLANAAKSFLPERTRLFVALIVVSALFTFVNFNVSIAHLMNGSPEILDGKFVQNNHGTVVQITEDQFHLLKYIQLRAFSGHWVLFSVVPMGYFFGRRNRPFREKKNSKVDAETQDRMKNPGISWICPKCQSQNPNSTFKCGKCGTVIG